MARGYVWFFQNRPGPAIEAFERAVRLSPLDPLGYLFSSGVAFAHFGAGRYEEAIDWADRSLRELPRYAASVRIKLVLCGLLGRVREARDCLARMLELQPGLTIRRVKEYAALARFPLELLPAYLEGLRTAGLPEE